LEPSVAGLNHAPARGLNGSMRGILQVADHYSGYFQRRYPVQ